MTKESERIIEMLARVRATVWTLNLLKEWEPGDQFPHTFSKMAGDLEEVQRGLEEALGIGGRDD